MCAFYITTGSTTRTATYTFDQQMLIFIYFGAWATFSAAGIFNLNVEDKHFSKRKISSSLLWANFTSGERAATAPISSAFAFYNIFAEGPLYDAIVKEQLFVLRSSRLYDAPLTNLYYDVVIGRNSSTYSISPDKKFLKLAWLPNETLQHLYKFCRQKHVSHNAKLLVRLCM